MTGKDLVELSLMESGDPTVQEILGLLKDKSVRICQFESLRQAELAQAALENKQITSTAIMAYTNDRGEEVGFVIIPTMDAEYAEEILKNESYKKMQYLSPEQMHEYAHGLVNEVALSQKEALLISNICKENNIPVTPLVIGDDECKLLFADKDRESFERIRVECVTALMSEQGELLNKQLDWELQYEEQLKTAIADKTTPEHLTTIIDRDGNSIEINNRSLVVNNRGEENTILRSHPNFEQRNDLPVSEKSHPVLVTENETKYLATMDEQQRKDFILEKEHNGNACVEKRPMATSMDLQRIAEMATITKAVTHSLGADGIAIQISTEPVMTAGVLEQVYGLSGLQSQELQGYTHQITERHNASEYTKESIEQSKIQEICDRIENTKSHKSQVPEFSVAEREVFDRERNIDRNRTNDREIERNEIGRGSEKKERDYGYEMER